MSDHNPPSPNPSAHPLIFSPMQPAPMQPPVTNEPGFSMKLAQFFASPLPDRSQCMHAGRKYNCALVSAQSPQLGTPSVKDRLGQPSQLSLSFYSLLIPLIHRGSLYSTASAVKYKPLQLSLTKSKPRLNTGPEGSGATRMSQGHPPARHELPILLFLIHSMIRGSRPYYLNLHLMIWRHILKNCMQGQPKKETNQEWQQLESALFSITGPGIKKKISPVQLRLDPDPPPSTPLFVCLLNNSYFPSMWRSQ